MVVRHGSAVVNEQHHQYEQQKTMGCRKLFIAFVKYPDENGKGLEGPRKKREDNRCKTLSHSS
jgi:hypothetical protein